MLCLAAENAAWKWMAKVCSAPCSRPGCLQIMLGSALVCSCCFRRRFANFKPFVFEEGLARKLCFHIFNYHLLREASHENFFHIFYFHVFRESRTKSSVFTTSTFSFGGWPCMIVFYIFKVEFLDFARKLRLHNFDFQFWREVWHESSVFTSSAFSFGGNSRTKAFHKLKLQFNCGKFVAMSFP